MQCLSLPEVPQNLRRMTSAQAQNRRYRKVLLAGVNLFIFKHSGKRKGERTFWIDPELKDLYWGINGKVSLPSGRFNIAHAEGHVCLKSICSVVVDRKKNSSTSKSFRARFNERPQLCLSLVLEDSTVDLEAPTPQARDLFAESLVNVVFGCPEDFTLGDEDDDFESDVDDSEALEKSDIELNNTLNQNLSSTMEPIQEKETAAPSATATAPRGRATEAYHRIYGARLNSELQSEIKSTTNRHKRTNSFITQALIKRDKRFERLANFVRNIREDFEADRGALFLVNAQTKTAASVVFEGQQGDPAEFKFNEGIVGLVAATGDIVIVPDAYEDPRFDTSADKEHAYKTTSLLVSPITDRAGRVVAVLELINRQDHPYTANWFNVEHAAKLSNLCKNFAKNLLDIRDFEIQGTLHSLPSIQQFLDQTDSKNVNERVGLTQDSKTQATDAVSINIHQAGASSTKK